MKLEGFGSISEQLRRSTVQIRSRRRSQGSGIIASSDGVIVTNSHVADDSKLEVQLWDGSSYPASLKRRNPGRDLAVLQIPARAIIPVTLANSDELRVGELVIAVGNPFGFMGAVTTGVVHAIGQRPGLGPAQWIQADLQLAPGNSGGPLADARGRVVGINTMVVGGLGLAVPSNAVTRILAGGAPRASLGVTVRPVRVQVENATRFGLAILEVSPGGAADSASLRAGDILVAIDGQALRSLDDLEAALDQVEPHLLRLQFLRYDPARLRTVTVRLTTRQAAVA